MIMDYFLRVEGVNLSNFVYDTSDLATIRGGSLLLLDAMDFVEKEIKDQIPRADPNQLREQDSALLEALNRAKHDKTLSKNDRKKETQRIREERIYLKKKAESEQPCCTTVTKGASWGLFKLRTDSAAAPLLADQIRKKLNSDKKYKHATFVINIYLPPEDEAYSLSRSKAQTLNRRQQLMEPSFAVIRQGSGICAYDKIRPAENKHPLPGDGKDAYLSESVVMRRKYGQEVKKDPRLFYQKRTLDTVFEGLELTRHLGQLSSCKQGFSHSHLENKIAFIYIDGNEFGKKQQACEKVTEQREFDQRTRKGRERVLKELLLTITGNVNEDKWFNDKKLRLETLLWGGDEIIWVVPAWQGWWMLKKFYELADEHIRLEETSGHESGKLYHGASMVFCNHKAPIQTIDSLAKSLADGFAKRPEFKQSNMFAYQVLESFDHAGSDLKGHRKMLIRGLSEKDSDLLIDGNDMQKIEDSIHRLKTAEFPRRKIYQIVHCYRRNDSQGADALYKKIIHENTGDTHGKKEQKSAIKKELDTLQKIFNNSHIFWLHLMELWDYIGLEETEGGM